MLIYEVGGHELPCHFVRLKWGRAIRKHLRETTVMARLHVVVPLPRADHVHFFVSGIHGGLGTNNLDTRHASSVSRGVTRLYHTDDNFNMKITKVDDHTLGSGADLDECLAHVNVRKALTTLRQRWDNHGPASPICLDEQIHDGLTVAEFCVRFLLAQRSRRNGVGGSSKEAQ